MMAHGGGPEAAQVAGAARPHILVVDDDAAVRKAIERMLTAAGFEVTSMHDGRAAVHLLTHARFDAVLTDIMMPGMSGIELLRATRATDLEVPVLLMTGSPDVKSAADAGFPNFKSGEHHPDPFASDKPLFTITPANLGPSRRGNKAAGLETSGFPQRQDVGICYGPGTRLSKQRTVGENHSQLSARA